MTSFADPTIEVLSRTPRYELIMGRLRHAGLRPIRAATNTASTQPCPILLDLVGAGDEVKAFLSSPSFSKIAAQRVIVLLGAPNQPALDPGLLQIKSVDQISSLPARLAIRQREARRVQEAILRAKTARSLGDESRPDPKRKMRVLYLGEYGYGFIALKSALQERGIETVAALSHVTADDYLDTGDFQAILLHPKDENDEAARYLLGSGLSAYRANIHLCLLEAPNMGGFVSMPSVGDIDSLISDSLPPPDIAETLLQEISRNNNRTPATTAALASKSQGPAGLFSRTFFNAHLQAQIDETEKTADPLSLICMSAQDDALSVNDWSKPITQHLRDTDLAALFDHKTVCISLRATPYRGAVALARRIEESVDVPVVWRAVERRRFHTFKTLLSAVTMTDMVNQRRRA